jgi:hypothetical protein
MTQGEFEAMVSMAYEGREQWDAFLDRVWSIHTSELPRWKSVANELPEQNRWVLTYNGSSINLLMLAGNGGWYDHSVAKHHNITHWMPLPQPPIVSKMKNTEKKGGAQ